MLALYFYILNFSFFGSIFLLVLKRKEIKFLGLIISIVIMIIPLYLFILHDNGTSQFQTIFKILNFNLGIDGISLIFILLTTLLVPISIISNWNTMASSKYFIYIILNIENLLILTFLSLDMLFFFILFELTLPYLWLIVAGISGVNLYRIKASFYLFIYTILGSFFLLIAILIISHKIGSTDYNFLSKNNMKFMYQKYLFIGIFIAFAVKTPIIFLHNWLLKAHVESSLAGSIILAGIVLKLSIYGIFRLIIPFISKSFLHYTLYIAAICVTSLILTSLSTIRTTDTKELIAYSSVAHAAVYLLGAISNNIQGIQGSMLFGVGHGLVSPGLFISVGGILYDRYLSRDINSIRGITQIMPIFSVFFLIFSLANSGVPLTLNFMGEFLSLYGIFERLPILGIFSSLSIIFSAGYNIYMYNRIAFGQYLCPNFSTNLMADLTKREFHILFILAIITVWFGIFPNIILFHITSDISNLLFMYTGDV